RRSPVARHLRGQNFEELALAGCAEPEDHVVGGKECVDRHPSLHLGKRRPRPWWKDLAGIPGGASVEGGVITDDLPSASPDRASTSALAEASVLDEPEATREILLDLEDRHRYHAGQEDQDPIEESDRLGAEEILHDRPIGEGE